MTESMGIAPAEWWRGAVIYQIYPRSFLDTNGDGIGDLQGVLQKLEYVASLGVDGIWLSPFFLSPMKDFGYDIADYCSVDPIFGSLADFDRIIKKAHSLGLKVIIDQVWAHTSDRHKWFVESSASKDNPKSDWYVWADAKADGSPPNNWLATFGGASWTWSPRRKQYYLHDFLSEQPDLNYWNVEVQNAILEVARFWLDRGVDGFRLDVINHLFHDKDLRDNPPAATTETPDTVVRFQQHIWDKSRPETYQFLTKLRQIIDQYDSKMLVGEIFDERLLELQKEYTIPPDRLQTAYSFFLLEATEATPALFAEALMAWASAPGWPSWSTSNHDVERVATRMAAIGGQASAKVILAILLCLRGTIFLYQGEELGLPQATIPFERLRDPFAIAAYTGGSGRDGARTPIPWTGEEPSCGFSSSSETWLPIDPDHSGLNVERQEADANSPLQFARRMIAVRALSPALKRGEAIVHSMPHGVLGFERVQDGERVLCMFELYGRPAAINIKPGASILFAVSGRDAVTNDVATLGPFGGLVLRLVTHPN